MASGFQTLLKEHRKDRGFSQLDLAMESGCSQRHISFLESGRARPSRTMVVSLSEAIGIPSRGRNELLLAAGFAPAYSEHSLDDPDLALVKSALDRMLQSHEPCPAFVLNWRHDIVSANEAAKKLILFLFDAKSSEDLPEFATNIVKALLHPDGFRAHIANWSQVASEMMRRIHAEVAALARPEEGEALLEELRTYEGIPQTWRQCTDIEWRTPMLTIEVAKDGLEMSVFSILSSLGAPYDITLQETRIESFYPADENARRFFERA